MGGVGKSCWYDVGMTKQKTIIFDIDGTAIDSPAQKIPSKRLVGAAQRIRRDYNLCAATGRAWSFAAPVIQNMKLTDPCIVSGGTQICDPQTGRVIWQCDIDQADIASVIEIARQYPDYKVLYNDSDEDAYLYGGHSVAELEITGPTYFFEFIFVPSTVAPEIITKLSEIEGIACTLVVAQRQGFNDIHVTNRNATKEHAVARLLSILEADSSQTVGIGDGHNDIHLFRAVNHKVAMGNAVPELIAAADTVIKGVTTDGLAEFFEQIAP